MIVKPDFNRLDGFFRGKVIKRSDRGSGYVKIFIPGVYPAEFEEAYQNLPDAEPAMPIFGGCLNGNGMFSYPNIGSTVWCFFMNGDQNYPVYFAATYGGPDAGGQFKNCEQLSKNDDGAYVHKICCGKTTIILSETGNLVIETRTVNGNNEIKSNRILFDQNGNVSIEAGTSMTIEAPDIQITAKNRLKLESSSVEIVTNSNYLKETVKDANQFVVQTDTATIDCANGSITTFSKISGARML